MSTTWTISSVKGTRTVKGTARQALDAAAEDMRNLQPAFGVAIERDEHVWATVLSDDKYRGYLDAESELVNELIALGVDRCLRAAQAQGFVGGDEDYALTQPDLEYIAEEVFQDLGRHPTREEWVDAECGCDYVSSNLQSSD
jgi:hypothetical protein